MPPGDQTWARLAAVVLVFLVLPQQAFAAPQPMLLGIEINGEDKNVTLPVVFENGMPRLHESDLMALGFVVPPGEAGAGHAYVPLPVALGASATIDKARTMLVIACPASCFRDQRIDAMPFVASELTGASTGVFLNYDLVGELGRGGPNLGALVDIAAFGGWGTVNSSAIARGGRIANDVIRLETAWLIDDPAKRRRIVLGDSIARAGRWSLPFRFAGAQIATDFSLQPGFITYPVPIIAGATGLPATADVYIDNVRRYGTRLGQGPFAISDLPLITGAGDLRMVVTDVLGRAQVIAAPYYVAPQLLSAGLSEASAQAGVGRRDFGVESFNYAEPFGAVTYARGLSDTLTGEVHLEGSAERGAVGGTVTQLLGTLGVGELSLAFSQQDDGPGALVGLGFERQAGRFSFGFSTEITTDHFTLLGVPQGVALPRQRSQAAFGVALEEYGQMSLVLTRLDDREYGDLFVGTATYSRNIGTLGVLQVTGYHVGGDTESTGFEVGFIVPLGARGSGSLSYRQDEFGGAAVARAQRSPPTEGGLGYRAQAAVGARPLQAAGATWLGDAGQVDLDAASYDGDASALLQARGAVVGIGGRLYPARPIDESFALVEVPGLADVEVFKDNRPIGRTDDTGRLLVTGLRPYQQNRISVDAARMPLDATIDRAVEEAVPAFRAGTRIVFPIRRERAALVTVVTADGTPVPAGAVARLAGLASEFPVGGDGRVYLHGEQLAGRLSLAWNDGGCSVSLPEIPVVSPYARIGPLRCAP